MKNNFFQFTSVVLSISFFRTYNWPELSRLRMRSFDTEGSFFCFFTKVERYDADGEKDEEESGSSIDHPDN